MSVNYNDYKAAVERLRRVASGENSFDVYGEIGHVSDPLTDKALIYDAEHDREPATVEWLREIGFNEISGRLELGKIEIESTGFRLYVYPGCVLSPTRGDVLTALRLFKKEGA